MATALFVLSITTGCDRNEEQSEQSAVIAPAAVATPPSSSAVPVASTAGSADAEVAEAGLPHALIENGCYACHAVNGARIGPPYRAIAGLYRNDPVAVDKLTQKVINGGGGVWGPVPMIAHPHLAPEKVRPLVEAIIKLN
jgi:cytochrome c